jgi:hypothetical protein
MHADAPGAMVEQCNRRASSDNNKDVLTLKK